MTIRKRDTLRIYGDSFAELLPHHGGHRGPHRNMWLSQTTWHEIVNKSGIWRKVLIYAEGASSLWHQWQKFETTIQPGDDVLWFETDPARLVSTRGHRFTGLNSTERVLAEGTRRNRPDLGPLQQEILDVYCAARDYYLYLYRPDYVDWVHNRILERIQELAPRVRFIACFDVSHTHNRESYAHGHMALATAREFEVFAKHHPQVHKMIDARRNHLTEINHRRLADMICEHYTTGAPIDMNTFCDPLPETWDKYFHP